MRLDRRHIPSRSQRLLQGVQRDDPARAAIHPPIEDGGFVDPGCGPPPSAHSDDRRLGGARRVAATVRLHVLTLRTKVVTQSYAIAIPTVAVREVASRADRRDRRGVVTRVPRVASRVWPDAQLPGRHVQLVHDRCHRALLGERWSVDVARRASPETPMHLDTDCLAITATRVPDLSGRWLARPAVEGVGVVPADVNMTAAINREVVAAFAVAIVIDLMTVRATGMVNDHPTIPR